MSKDPPNWAITFTAWVFATTGIVAGAFWWDIVDGRLQNFQREFRDVEGILGLFLWAVVPTLPAIVCGRIVRMTSVQPLTVTLATAAIGHVCGAVFVLIMLIMHV